MPNRQIFALIALCACGSTGPTAGPPAITEGPAPEVRGAEVFATATRPARGPEEDALARAGFVFDPALDCVAARAGDPPDPRRYRGEAAIACGSPLYPVEARRVATGELEAAVGEMRQRFGATIPLALGTGAGVVVIAARTVEIEPFRRGDRVLRGKTLLDTPRSDVFVSRADGVTRRPIALSQRAFAVAVPEGDADVELSIVDGAEFGPLARVRIGAGSPLVGMDGSALERANAARARLGQKPLVLVRASPGCDDVPPQLAGEDVTDRAACRSVIRETDPDVLASDLMWSPLIQSSFVDPKSAFLEIGLVGDGLAMRVTRRFEVLTPEAGRERILAQYRTWWPGLPEQAAPPEAYQPIFDAWKLAPDLSATPPANVKAMLDKVASRWSKTPSYWSALATSRDLEKALEFTKPNEKPLAIDVAMIQVRDAKGAMRHMVVVILALP